MRGRGGKARRRRRTCKREKTPPAWSSTVLALAAELSVVSDGAGAWPAAPVDSVRCSTLALTHASLCMRLGEAARSHKRHVTNYRDS